MPGPLTNSKHELAAVYRFSGSGVHEAYLKAGFKGNDSQSTKLFKRKDVQARITELREEFQKRVFDDLIVTKESITKEMTENRDFARKQKNPGAMNTATKDKATLHGLMDTKTTVDLNIKSIHDMNEDELRATKARLLGGS